MLRKGCIFVSSSRQAVVIDGGVFHGRFIGTRRVRSERVHGFASEHNLKKQAEFLDGSKGPKLMFDILGSPKPRSPSQLRFASKTFSV